MSDPEEDDLEDEENGAASSPKNSEDVNDDEDGADGEGEEEYGEKFWDNLDEDDRAGYEDNMNKD